MTGPHVRFDEDVLGDRSLVVADAVASLHLEGLSLDRSTSEDFDQFIPGTISLSNVRSRIQGRFTAHRVLSNGR